MFGAFSETCFVHPIRNMSFLPVPVISKVWYRLGGSTVILGFMITIILNTKIKNPKPQFDTLKAPLSRLSTVS
jgi:hypothetical protein